MVDMRKNGPVDETVAPGFLLASGGILRAGPKVGCGAHTRMLCAKAVHTVTAMDGL